MNTLVVVTQKLGGQQTAVPSLPGHYLVSVNVISADDGGLLWVGTFAQSHLAKPLSPEQILDALKSAPSLFAAAKALGVSAQTLKARMDDYGIVFQPVVKGD